jgi:hypothetical protein
MSKNNKAKQHRNGNNGNGDKNSRKNYNRRQRKRKITLSRGKELEMSGSDFIQQLSVFPRQLMDGPKDDQIKLVYQIDISPSSFPNTRLELISNCYQLFRFSKFKVNFKSMLPTAVNGLFMAYCDTDPDDKISLEQTATEILRIAKSHQGSTQGKIRDNWSFNLPVRKDDQMFFIGERGNESRLRKMGTIYIYQIGTATKFDGSPLTEELIAGTLNVDWTVTFMNPQLQQLDRIVNGETQKNILRIFKNLAFYRGITVPLVTSANWIAGTKYRQANIQLDGTLFTKGGIGSYMIMKVPIKITIPNTVKAFHSFSLPKSSGNYKLPGTDLFTLLANAVISKDELTNFVDRAFGLLKGGIDVAKQIFDVATLVSSIFLASQVTGVSVTGDIDDPLNSSPIESLPIGQTVVSWDGTTKPLIQELIEFHDAAHASDNTVDVNYTVLLLAFKILETEEKIVEPKLPYLKTS